MKLELDLTPGDWTDYGQAPIADLKRVGVLIPTEPVGIRHFVRLGTLVDGKPVVVVTPWQIWAAATRALAERLGEGHPEPAAAAPRQQQPAVLADVEAAMAEHVRRWGIGPEHDDGTSASWKDDAEEVRQEATAAAVNDILTWSHTLLEATYAVMATDDPAELRKALALVAGCAANWMVAIDGRDDA